MKDAVSPVSVVADMWAGRPSFGSRQGQGFFFFATVS
jgi:hypothetical protein